MTVIDLYKYDTETGFTVTPIKPNDDVIYESMYRLVADKNKSLTRDHIEFYSVIDTETLDGWQEVDYVEIDNQEKVIDDELKGRR